MVAVACTFTDWQTPRLQMAACYTFSRLTCHHSPGLATLKVSGYQLELIQCALRVGKGVLARAPVGNAISYTSPRYGRLKCLYLLRRYLAKFGLCCSD